MYIMVLTVNIKKTFVSSAGDLVFFKKAWCISHADWTGQDL